MLARQPLELGQALEVLRVVGGVRAGLDVVLPAPAVCEASPVSSTGPDGVRARYAVLPGVWPGTQSAQSEPSPKTSRTPSKRPLGSGANAHSLTGGSPSSARSMVPRDQRGGAPRRRLARARVERRGLGTSGMPVTWSRCRWVKKTPGQRRLLLRQPVAQRLVHLHLLQVHHRRDHAPHRRRSGASRSAFSTPVSTMKVPRVGGGARGRRSGWARGRPRGPAALAFAGSQVDEPRRGTTQWRT